MKARLALRGSAGEFSRLVAFAETFAERCGLPAGERSRLLVILEELFTNTVRHGYPQGVEQGHIEVALAARPGRVEIEFSDDGVGFDPLAHDAPPIDRSPAERAPGGVGLHLLRGLTDEARYRRSGGRNRLILVRYLACG